MCPTFMCIWMNVRIEGSSASVSWRCKRQIVAVVVQLLVVTPRTAALQASLSFLISQSVFTLMSVESCCHPTISASVTLFSSCPQAFPASGSLHQVPNNWSFSFSISPSNEYSGLISFRIDFLRPRNFQESPPAPQFEGINSLVLSLLYGPSLTSVRDSWEKTIALTIRGFVGKVMSLLFNTVVNNEYRYYRAELPQILLCIKSC